MENLTVVCFPAILAMGIVSVNVSVDCIAIWDII